MRRSERRQIETLRRYGWAAGTFSAIGLLASPAEAQMLDRFLSPNIYGIGDQPGVTILSRQRPDYASSGIRAGNFTIRPVLNERFGYESNVLGTNNSAGSTVLQTNAAVDVNSDISRVNLNAGLSVDNYQYFERSDQSYTNWTARLFGSYELGRDVVSAQYTHLNLNQTARDLNVPQQLNRPISYQVDTGLVSYRANFSRVFITPSFTVSNYVYSGSAAQGVTFRQNFRDRILFTPSVTAGYEFSPRRNALLVVSNSTASYKSNAPGLPKRDYNDFSILAGLDYDVTGLLRIRALAGYGRRTFNESVYSTIQAPIAEVAAIWSPTGLTTLTATVARRIQDAADETTAGYKETSAAFTIDHEYLRNILLQANAGVFYNEYNGGGTQTLYSIGTGASYLLNRNVSLSANYDFTSRSSGNRGTVIFNSLTQQSGSGYDDHRILVGLRFGL